MATPRQRGKKGLRLKCVYAYASLMKSFKKDQYKIDAEMLFNKKKDAEYHHKDVKNKLVSCEFKIVRVKVSQDI